MKELYESIQLKCLTLLEGLNVEGQIKVLYRRVMQRINHIVLM